MRYYVLLPGVRSDPRDWANWAPRMATEINLLTSAKADEFRYMAFALTPKARQEERAEYVRSLAQRAYSAGYDVVLVGHSNGCEVIRQALEGLPPIVHSVHLIAGATEADMELAGWNRFLRKGIVGHLFIYKGTRDRVLQWIAAAGAFLGYGRLGWLGPKNIAPDQAHKITVIERPYEHCEWFEGFAFAQTREAITVAERLHD